MSYKERSNGIPLVMEQNTSSSDCQKSLSNWTAAQTLERTLHDLEGLEIADPSPET